jgi:4-carboxymuconolactone decarboxylase
VIGMNAAINRPAEFKVHVNGALNNGCTPEEIREVCLMVGLYAGIPAANDAHRTALEVFKERGYAVA